LTNPYLYATLLLTECLGGGESSLASAVEVFLGGKLSRRIIIAGEINEETYEAFSSQLHELEKESKTASVTLELSSEGGDAYYALAFSGRMRNSPCDIIVNAYGLVASAAVLILASGDIRYLAKEAWVMVHEDSMEELSGNVTEIEKTGKHLRRLEDQWAELLASMTLATKERWTELHKEESYLTAHDALELGIADKLI
jgi:ATP-dependent Clp protease, protease subunit